MNDHLTWEVLNDLVDGVLSPASATAAEAHARSCDTCRAALAELREAVTLARELPDSVTPPGDLWNDVRATIEQGKVARLPLGDGSVSRQGWFVTPARLAAAAVVLVATTASVTSLVLKERETDVVAVAPAPSATVSASWQRSEREFQASVLELREQLEMLHDHLSPQTLVKVEKAMATIDLAIAEAREALLRDPANAALSELLASNYRQKIDLLRRTAQLASS